MTQLSSGVLAFWCKMSPDHGSKVIVDVRYDVNKRIWKSVRYPFRDVTNRSVGAAFVESMRSLDPRKVLEYHYDVNKEKRAKDIHLESITVAMNLQRLNIGRGDVVVLFSGYNYWTSVLTFGSLLIGSVVNFFEVQLENEDIDVIMNVIQPAVILYESVFRHKVFKSLERKRPEALRYIFSVEQLDEELLKPIMNDDPAKFESVAITKPQTEVAFLVLTSGSTGLPKVIQLSHAAVLNGLYTWWATPCDHEPINFNSILFSLSPLRWISQIILLLQSAILGIKRICANKAASGSYGLQILQQTKPTHIFSVPSFFYDVLLELAADDEDSLRSLKFIQLGGEYPSKSIMELTKLHAVNSKLFHSYGMSEVSGSITNDEFISGGKLQPGYEMQILDDDLKALGPNANGRLAVRTPYPFIGYKGSEDTNNFLSNGFFLNGDYGYFDADNTLHLLARYKDLVLGNDCVLIPNIVESLAVNVAGIQMARLVGICNQENESDEIGCLFIVSDTRDPSKQKEILVKLRNILLSKLSASEMLHIQHFKFIPQFPLTTCGKIDRNALKNGQRRFAEYEQENCEICEIAL